MSDAVEQTAMFPAGLHVLLAEDDELLRDFLTFRIESLGFRVTAVEDGEQALSVVTTTPVDILVTDWSMPRMDGIDLVRRLRTDAAVERYLYIVMMTARASDHAMRTGLEAGVDDFLYKPLNEVELGMGLATAQRILRLQRRLERRNRHLAAANMRIRDAYRRIEADLEAAARIQKRLLPRPGRLGGFRFNWLFQPSSMVGGDIFGIVPCASGRLAFFQVDVAGHGVPAALKSFSIHTMLSAVGRPDAADWWLRPDAVATELNRRYLAENDDDSYFTLVYGVAEPGDGTITLARAGHPAPMLASPHHVRPVSIEEGGFPIGLLPEADYPIVRLTLDPGERLFVFSDGLTDCTDPTGQAFGEDRLAALVRETAALPLEAAVKAVDHALRPYRGPDGFADDVSLLVIEREPVP